MRTMEIEIYPHLRRRLGYLLTPCCGVPHLSPLGASPSSLYPVPTSPHPHSPDASLTVAPGTYSILYTSYSTRKPKATL